jgi:hypothetical protein
VASYRRGFAELSCKLNVSQAFALDSFSIQVHPAGWQIRDLKVSTSQLRYALRASEEQIQEAVKLKPGQQMLIDLYSPEVFPPPIQ